MFHISLFCKIKKKDTKVVLLAAQVYVQKIDYFRYFDILERFLIKCLQENF